MSVGSMVKSVLRRVPGKAWLAAGGLLVGAFWLQQHDARIRQQVRLKQLRSETSAQLASLRKQAAQAVKQANVENAKAIAELEQRRQQAEQQNRQLAGQLARLRRQARIQAGEVATLPLSEIVTRVASQLGLQAGDVVGKEEASPRKGAKAQRKLQVTNYELPKPGAMAALAQNTPHPAAGASTLSPRRGRGSTHSADGRRGALWAPAGGQSPPLQDTAVLPLTASGARKVEAALVALNACRAESKIVASQISTCQAQAAAGEAALKRQAGSIDSLNQALAAKDKILAQQQTEYRAELRAARGTFLGRLARVTEHVAVGLAVGVAIGVAVK